MQDHAPTSLGRAFFWGGLVLGLVLVVVLLTKGFGLFGRSASAGGEEPSLVHQGNKILVPASSPLRQRLMLMPAASEPVGGKLVLPGIVESDPARTAPVLTPLPGRVEELKVALGDRVTAGQVLAVIDSADLALAFDDDEKAADSLALTEKNLVRQEGQSQIGAASERDLDQARSDHTQAASEYRRTQAHLKAIGAPTDGKERSRLLFVRSPLSGSITNLAISSGNIVNDPTQPMMTVADLSTVWVTALVPEKDIGMVAKGEAAQVTLSAYPGRMLEGTVLFVSDVIEPDTRRNKLRIAFANQDYTLKPNMFATVTLIEPLQSRVVVPTSALLMNNDRTSVFVATAPWTFERRVVDPQLAEGPEVAIPSGVAAGEPVVVQGAILLND